ncbi:RHS repeat-associated core domain-containing protein [Paenibacillus sp. SI8]|uniref:RHS repeat-associated core domain-containing protein n=1 Tax=unclassified Paenibacillus TaxID=185978 RepID=UPI0034667517
MSKRLYRILATILLCSLLLTSLPIASNVSYAASAEKQQIEQEGKNKATEERKKELKDSYSISDDEIQAILDQGYTLDETESALGYQQQSKGALKESLERIKPTPINLSKEAQSKIQSDLSAQSYVEPKISAATTDPVPDYSYVNTSPDTAPYTVQLDQESISTLSGGLSMQKADMSLPGRNGLGFTLTRTYDSGSSQFNQMVTYGSSNGTIPSFEEKFFPIGKGWTWDISYIDVTGSSLYLHLGGAGVYKIVNYNLIGYPWRDLTFTPDNTVTVGTIKSAYALHSIQGITQYFDAKGHLLEYVDKFNNTVLFNYMDDPTYGTVLSSIVDAIGNSINITYSNSAVVIKKGTETVTYNKTTVNGKELLTQVVDALGRTTTYDYYMKDAFFNLLGTTPYISNPYALLIGVTHPTGSKTVYSYEDSATFRFTGANAVNQVFRATSREDQVTLSDGSVERYNHKDISFSGDMASSYGADIPSFSTTIKDGLTMNVFTNKKHYIDTDTPAVFYNMNQVSSAPQDSPTYTVTTNYTYDEINKYPKPITTQVIKSMQGSTNPVTTTTQTAYDPFGNVTSYVDVLGVTTTYTYDVALHLLVGVSKPISANQTQYTEYVRDAMHGNVIAVRVREGSASGAILQETLYENFDTYGNALQTRVKKNATTYTTFQTEYNTTAPYSGAFPTKQSINVTDANGSASTIVKRYDYNTLNGRLKAFTDGNSNTTNYEFDEIGRVTKAIHPDNSFIKVDYNDSQNQVQQTDETGVQSLTKWNPLGLKMDAGINEGGIYKSKAKYGYDSYGRLTWTEDALGNHTSYGYDQWSRQNLITYPGGSTASVLYDDTSVINTKTSTDAEGYVFKEYYDKGGRTTSKEETKKIAGGGTKTTTLGTFTFDNAGHVLTATDNQTPQNKTTYNYDTIGHLTSVLNAKNETTAYQYDNLGNLLQVTYPDSKTNLKKYDEIGRLIQTTDANGKVEKFFYDANSNQTGLFDRNLNYFKYTFDNRNFLKSKEITDASWNPIASEEKIGFSYDLAGRRTQMVDGTGTTGYNFSSSTGALSTQTYPDGKSIKYDYDTAGNRFVMNDPFGVNTYYHYDSRNRLDIVAPSADFLNNSNTTDYDAKYTYYNNSLLKQITQHSGVTSDFEYDGLRIGTLTEKKSNGTTLNTFTYTYDNNGNQKTRAEKTGNDPAVPAITNNFTYDRLNRISTSDQFNETYGYDNRGNRTSMTTNNPFDSPDSLKTFDKRDRLITVGLTPQGGNGPSVNYKYNGDGLLWERTENSQTTRYYWDGDQIIAEGNVNNQIVDNTSSAIQYTGSWVAQNDTNDYNGSMTYSGTANDSAQMSFTGTYVQVVARKGPSGGKADILIDGIIVASDVDTYPNSNINRQYQSVIYSNSSLTSGTHTIKVIVKGTKNPAAASTNVMLDYIAYGNGSASLKARYIRGQGLVAREDGQGKSYYLQNGHGDVVNLMDSTGNTKLNSYQYDIWGNIVSQQENLPQPFKYSGEMMDDKVGLQYLRARWYDPSMGRFVGEDTYEGQIDNPLSLNLYTYVSNNSLKYTDPTGHFEEIDNSMAHLWNKGEKEDMIRYTDNYGKATTNSERQYWHDQANALRLRYADSVTRRDMSTGAETTVYKTKTGGVGDTKSGWVAETYVKGTASISIVGTAGLQAKVQSGALSISFIKGLNGQLAYQLTASAGVSFNNGGNIENYVKKGANYGRFYFVEAEVSKDLEDSDVEGIVGGGLGYSRSVAIVPLRDSAYEHEIKLIELTSHEPSYPMSYYDWLNHIGQK